MSRLRELEGELAACHAEHEVDIRLRREAEARVEVLEGLVNAVARTGSHVEGPGMNPEPQPNPPNPPANALRQGEEGT